MYNYTTSAPSVGRHAEAALLQGVAGDQLRLKLREKREHDLDVAPEQQVHAERAVPNHRSARSQNHGRLNGHHRRRCLKNRLFERKKKKNAIFQILYN